MELPKIIKSIISIVIAINWISLLTLWNTRVVNDLPSQSAFWDQPNSIWYVILHMSMITIFLLLYVYSRHRRPMYFLTAVLSGTVLLFDMDNTRWIHNIGTGMLFFAASFSIVIYGSTKWSTAFVIICMLCAILFGIGLSGGLGTNGVFIAESIIEFSIGICIILDMWTTNNKNYNGIQDN